MTNTTLQKFFAFLFLSFYAFSHIQPKSIFPAVFCSAVAFADESEEEESDDEFFEEQTGEDDVIEDIDDIIEDNEEDVLEELLNDEDEEENSEESTEEEKDETPNPQDVQAFEGSGNQAASDAHVDNKLK